MHKFVKKAIVGALGVSAGLPVFAEDPTPANWDFAEAKTAINGMGQGISDLFLGANGVLAQYKTVILAVGTLVVVGIAIAWVFSAARRRR